MADKLPDLRRKVANHVDLMKCVYDRLKEISGAAETLGLDKLSESIGKEALTIHHQIRLLENAVSKEG